MDYNFEADSKNYAMAMSTRMRGDIGWMLVGRFVNAISLWCVVIALAHLGSAEMLGRYTYALALIAPLVMFSRLNLRVFMVTDVERRFHARDYLSTRLVTNALVLICVVVLVGFQNMEPLLAGTVLSVMVFKLAESSSDFYHGQMQLRELIRPFAMSLALHGVVCLAAFTIALVVFDSLIAGALLTAVGWVFLLYGYDRPQASGSDGKQLRITFARVPSVMKSCLLLGVLMGLLSLRINLPVYFIKGEFGLEDLGLYSAAAYFLLIGNLIATSVMEVSLPRLARARVEQGRREVGRLSLSILALLLGMGGIGICLALLFGEWAMLMIYGEPYAQAGGLLVLFAIAVTISFAAQLLGSLLTIRRLFAYQILANLTGIFTIALVCEFSLPPYGLIGAGMAIIAGNLALLLVNALSVLSFRKTIFPAHPLNTSDGSSP